MCHRLSRLLDCDPVSVTAGRHFVADALAGWGMTSDAGERHARDDILLVTTELLSNAVKAASRPVILNLEGHHHRVDVSVTDDSPESAVVLPPGIDQPGGRGLRIIDALAQRWGQQRLDSPAKEVWAQLAIPAGAPLSVDCTLPRS